MVNLRDIVFNHPEWMAIACIAWIAIAVWILSLIGWMVQGEVDPLFGFVGIGIAFVLGYFSFMPPAEILRPFTAIAIVVTVVVFPFLRSALNQRALVAIDIEAMENSYEQLRLKPDNHMARFKLAKLLHARGHIGPAIAVGSEALREMPEKLFSEEHRTVGRWKRQNPQIQPNEPVLCVNCGHRNAPSNIHCERCNQPYLLEVAKGRWVGRQFARRLIGAWIAGILALAGIPLASQLPPGAAIVVIVAIMVSAVLMVWIAFRSTGEGSKA